MTIHKLFLMIVIQTGKNIKKGAIEIQCACNIWNVRIIVLNNRDCKNRSIEFIQLSGQYDRTIYLEWTGGHYEPVRN